MICANITGRFEQDIARGLWGEARASYNAPTRRKKEQAKFFLLKDPNGISGDLTVSAEKYPALMIFYKMPIAGILAGIDYSVNRLAQWELKVIVDANRFEEFQLRHPGRLTATFNHVPDSFGRMLAKIGHCYLLTALDLSDFNPICLPYVLGKKSNVSHVVGSSPINAPLQLELGYSLRVVQLSTVDRTLLMVEIRLLANNDTPTYHIVVGEVDGRENVDRISKKLNAVQPAEKAEEVTRQSAPLSGYPWIPQVWPLKL